MTRRSLGGVVDLGVFVEGRQRRPTWVLARGLSSTTPPTPLQAKGARKIQRLLLYPRRVLSRSMRCRF